MYYISYEYIYHRIAGYINKYIFTHKFGVYFTNLISVYIKRLGKQRRKLIVALLLGSHNYELYFLTIIL